MFSAIQKIIKIGSSLGVTISKGIRSRLGLAAGDSVEVSFSVPGKDRQDHIAKLTKNFVERYRKDLEVLADK